MFRCSPQINDPQRVRRQSVITHGQMADFSIQWAHKKDYHKVSCSLTCRRALPR